MGLRRGGLGLGLGRVVWFLSEVGSGVVMGKDDGGTRKG